MAETFSPIVYEESTKSHQPAALGLAINPSHILVDRSVNNLITNDETGLSVKLASFVSEKEDNKLSIEDGKLYVKDEIADIKPSAQEGNALRLGTDGLLYVDGADINSTDSSNLIAVDPSTKKIALTAAQITDALKSASEWSGISKDANQLLSLGSDGFPFLDADRVLSNDAKNLLRVDATDHRVTLTPEDVASKVKSLTLSTQKDNYARLGEDGGIFLDGNDVLSNGDENLLRIDATDKKVTLTAQTIIDALKKDISWDPVSQDTGNIIYHGSDHSAFLSGADLISRNSNNLLTTGTDNKPLITAKGIVASIVSPNAGNKLTIDDTNLLFVEEIKPVSEDEANLIYPGSDKKAYVTGKDLISHNDGNMLQVGSDSKVLFTMEHMLEMGISAEPNNAVRAGVDNKLFVDNVANRTPSELNVLSGRADNMLVYDSAGKILFAGDLGTM